MRCLALTGLALVGLAALAPVAAQAQMQSMPTNATGDYQPVPASNPAPAAAPAPEAQPAPAPAPVPAAAPHKHKGRVLCAACMAKAEKKMVAPPGKIIACAHSKNGVCSACRAALEMPGPMVMMGPNDPVAPMSGGSTMIAGASAPGRAVVADAGDPMPVGVMQANYSQGGPAAASSSTMAAALAPGRAVASSTVGPEIYQRGGNGFPRPHILGHLFGWSYFNDGRKMQEERKSQSHASIPYNNEGTTITDVPASVIYGKR
jgi:2-oxoglutarate dehydrogenase E2 component (dihydrolipoamide succinyltransferase)